MDTQTQAGHTEEENMLPPPPGTFQDREALIKHVRDYGASQGYVVTIKKSRKDRRVILGCDRGGLYRNRRKIEESKRKRKTCSRLINCPFEAIGKKHDDVWLLTVRNGTHNHEPLRDMSEHPSSRRFSEEEVRQIKLMTEAGLKPSQVLKTLKQNNPELQSTPRHLYNLKAKMRQGNLSDKIFQSWQPNRSVPINNATSSGSLKQNNQQLKVRNFIGGKFVDSQGHVTIDVLNPATQEVVSQVPLSTYEDFKTAVSAAKLAFPAWKSTPNSTRQQIMFRLHELIRRDIDKLASKITMEQGKTLSAARSDVLYGLEVVQHACCVTTLQKGEFVPNASTGIDTYCIREPLGVCAGICPYNFPSTIPFWTFPIAVACGNTFVHKPSEKNPGPSIMLAALAVEAGLPDGVLNIVNGTCDIINYICEDDDIKAISVTGPSAVCMEIYARAASTGKRIQSNIVGNNYLIVMPDASIDATLNALAASAFAAGQKSIALSTAVFVGDSRHWEDKLVELAKTLRVNAGTDPRADIGPIISKEVMDCTSRLIQVAVDNGARLLLDGRNITVPGYEKGNFIGPTILRDIISNIECYKDEIVGPVLVCMEAECLEEAISMVNSDRSVNGASIFTTSSFAAREFQNEILAAEVGINIPVPAVLPFTSSNESKAWHVSDRDYCGKTGVHFFTWMKRVSQHWKDIPDSGMPSGMRLSSKTNRRNQGVPLVFPSSPQRDSSSRRATGSMSTASTSNNSPTQESFLPLRDGSSLSPTNLDLSNGETSLAVPRAAERDFTAQGMSPATPQISQWNNSPSLTSQRAGSIPVPPSERIYMPSSSQRVVNSSMALPCNKAYLPTSNNNNAISAPTSHQTDERLNQSSERVYMLTTPHLNDNGMVQSQTFQRTDNTLFPISERIYMPSGSAPQRTDIPLHLDSFQRNSRMPSGSQQAEVMSSNSERMYVPSIVQRSSGVPSTNERLYIPAAQASQRIYEIKN